MKTAFPSRRARRCVAGSTCVLGGRIMHGDKIVRARQHEYIHQADIDALGKVFEVVIDFDLSGFLRAMDDVVQTWVHVARQIVTTMDRIVLSVPSLDAMAFDTDPDRCWRCNAKPGMEDLDGMCWHCWYDLTGRKP